MLLLLKTSVPDLSQGAVAAWVSAYKHQVPACSKPDMLREGRGEAVQLQLDPHKLRKNSTLS